MIDDKHCPRCNEDWPADTDFFHADAKNSDGLSYCCKACQTEPRHKARQRVDMRPRVRATDALAQLDWIGGQP